MRRMWRDLCLTAALAAVMPAAAAAQGTPPQSVRQDVFVTATVSPLTVDRVGQSTVTLSREDLARLGVIFVADALRLAPGVDVRARGPWDIQADFSIRGATFGQNLILIDGHRLNDSQTGHHNGDVPVTIADIERIEIVTGPGSATHGADALGGTINIITRSDRHAAATLMGGQHGYAAAQVSLQGVGLPGRLSTSIWGSRSSGFAPDRDFLTGGASMTTRLARGWTLDVRHVNKTFGADGFYGPSASKEWTNQTVASADWHVVRGGWTSAARILARSHGDHFRWDITRPGFAENRHRTNAFEASETAARSFGGGARLSIGGGGGTDWVASSNLGDRQYAHGFGFVEAQQPLGSRSVLVAGLRFDNYSTFGHAVSPSISTAVQLSKAARLRASLSRGFRVPTFTELYLPRPGESRDRLTCCRAWMGRRRRSGLDGRPVDVHGVGVRPPRHERDRLGAGRADRCLAVHQRPRRHDHGRGRQCGDARAGRERAAVRVRPPRRRAIADAALKIRAGIRAVLVRVDAVGAARSRRARRCHG